MNTKRKEKAKERYAAIPARAMADKSLSAEHLRVLMAMAVHDGMGRNGYGCTASHKRLAELTGCHVKSLSRTIKFLIESSYVAESKMLGKLRVYRVIYTDADAILINRRVGSKSATREQNTTAAVIDIGSKLVTSSDQIGNKTAEVSQQFQRDAEDKISCINNKNKKNPAEAASPDGDAMAEKGSAPSEDEQIARYLRHVESATPSWRQALERGHKFTADQVLELTETDQRLWEIAAQYDGVKGTPLGGWAYRLLSEIADLRCDIGRGAGS